MCIYTCLSVKITGFIFKVKQPSTSIIQFGILLSMLTVNLSESQV